MDLNILPLARIQGQDLPALPGLHITSQPRRPTRSRQNDRLILYFRLEGNLPLEPDQQDQLLARISQGYYKTPGSVTAAMRTIAETLNQYLLDRNLRESRSGRQSYGLLMIAVARGEQVFLGQCGSMHAFRIAPNAVEHYFDQDLTHRGLGLSRATPITYFQLTLEKDDALLFCPHPPELWVAGGLSGAYGQGPESLRRRLTSQAGEDLEAVLVLAKAGSGNVHLLSARPTPTLEEPASGTKADAEAQVPPVAAPQPSQPIQPPVARAAVEPTPAAERPELPPSPVQPAPAPPAEMRGRPEQPFSPPQARPPDLIPENPAESTAGLQQFQPARPAETPPPAHFQEAVKDTPDHSAGSPAQAAAESLPAQKPGGWFARRRQAKEQAAQNTGQAPPAISESELPQKRQGPSPVVKGLAGVGSGFRRVTRGAARISGAILKRLLPGEGTLPSSVMAFFAVGIPVMVVAAAMYVYLQEGVTKQYLAAFAAASQAAEAARAETNPDSRRQAWMTVVAAVDQAENYQVTDATRGLLVEAQDVFDQLDIVRRLDFQPAIVRGLADDARITRIVATNDDLYLLDEKRGSVWRALRTTRGYEIDTNFACGPSLPGTLAVGPLIDIAPIPKGSEMEGVLLAMDGAGNILQCIIGAQPLASVLAPPPAGWGTPTAFVLDSGNLYVLDPHPKKNAVWAYWGADFSSQPQLFFQEDIPPMEDVTDMAVDKRDLYLLHADGHITLCTFSDLGVAPTRCADPVPYSDSRPGHEGQTFQPEHPFTQIVTTQPPDPSLYLLESQTQAIYHFSLRLLTYQKQLQPIRMRAQGANLSFPDEPATAFALSPDSRIAFLALGNQVYYAGTP